MANAQGFSESLVMGLDASFKTPPGGGNPSFKIPVINPSLKPTVTRFKSEALAGSAQPRVPVDGKIELQGSFDVECTENSLGYPLKGLLSDPIDRTIDSGFAHIYQLGAVPFWFFEQKFTDIGQYISYEGCIVNKGSFNLDPEGLMKATFNVMGASTAVASSPYSTSITDKTLKRPFSYLTGVINYKGTASTLFQNFKIDIDRQGEAVKTIDGTNQLADIITKIAVVGGSVKLLFDDAVILSDALNSTEVSARISVSSPTAGFSLRFYLPTLKFMPSGPTTNGPGGLVTQEFTYDAYGAASTSNVPGFTMTKAFATVTLGGSNLIKFKAIGGTDTTGTVENTVTLSASAQTPAQIAASFNADVNFNVRAVAYVENTRVVLETLPCVDPTQVPKMEITTSTGTAGLGLTVAAYSGYRGHAVTIVYLNADSAY